MKRYIFILLFFVSSIPLIAQDNNFTFFNKILVEDTAAILVNAVLPIENSYLVAGLWADVNNTNNRAIFLTKLDAEGQVLWTKFLDHSNTVSIIQSGNAFIRDAKNPNQYLVLYSKYRDTTRKNVDVAVTKFSEDGTILWTKLNGDVNKQSPFTLINTHDGGYFATGWQQVEANPITSYALKLDSLGNKQWSNTYTLDEKGHCSTPFVFQTMDKGYVLSGYGNKETTIGDFIAYLEQDMYLFKIDTNGDMVWEQNYGTDYSDAGCIVQQLSDETFFLSGKKRQSNFDEAYFAKLNNKGEVLWDKTYEINNYHSAYLSINNDEDFIGYGHILNDDYRINPYLMKLTSRGDTLWTKPITPDLNNDVYIRDMEATPDGGYIIAGFNYTHTPQYGWIAKIDSLGNTCWSSLDCDSTVVFTDIPQLPIRNPYEVQIAPNPVRDIATISYQLPLDGRLGLYDLQGRWVREWWLPAAVENMPMEIGDLESGLYLYRVSMEGKEVSSGKLVVE